MASTLNGLRSLEEAGLLGERARVPSRFFVLSHCRVVVEVNICHQRGYAVVFSLVTDAVGLDGTQAVWPQH